MEININIESQKVFDQLVSLVGLRAVASGSEDFSEFFNSYVDELTYICCKVGSNGEDFGKSGVYTVRKRISEATCDFSQEHLLQLIGSSKVLAISVAEYIFFREKYCSEELKASLNLKS
jgi:hypothetical protein